MRRICKNIPNRNHMVVYFVRKNIKNGESECNLRRKGFFQIENSAESVCFYTVIFPKRRIGVQFV